MAEYVLLGVAMFFTAAMAFLLKRQNLAYLPAKSRDRRRLKD